MVPELWSLEVEIESRVFPRLSDRLDGECMPTNVAVWGLDEIDKSEAYIIDNNAFASTIDPEVIWRIGWHPPSTPSSGDLSP